MEDNNTNKNNGSENSESLKNEETPKASPEATADTGLEKYIQDLAKAKSDYLYLHAEFDNYRKNAIKERSQYLKYAGERMIVELLGVHDNFERALQSFKNSPDDPFFKGMDLIKTQFKTVLEQFGVVEVPAEGKPFDPMVHEALSSEESETVEPGTVTKVFRKAYKLHDRLIRPAQVVVATKKL
ncbi:MAG: hypothetical protein A4S09_08775 [Proteobacteria bacterium SG_bin7]|nr:MAG: hypothetical protein A4S09_08775 [Proteobacteria bacterium SG_bin7]